MMCSHESVPIGPGMRYGRIAIGGIAGGWLSGLGGGFSLIESQSGICLHAPSPVQNHSHLHAAWAGAARNTSRKAAIGEARLIECSIALAGRRGNANALAECY